MNATNVVNLPDWVEQSFTTEITSLSYNSETFHAFAGHFDPEDPGVTEQFLENAAAYDAHYLNLTSIQRHIQASLNRAGLTELRPRRVLDVGSGSGNSVLALAELYPEAAIVASDLSPS